MRITGELLKARFLSHLQTFWFNSNREYRGTQVSPFFTRIQWGDFWIKHTLRNTNESDVHFSWCPFSQSLSLQARKAHWKCQRFVALLSPGNILEAFSGGVCPSSNRSPLVCKFQKALWLCPAQRCTVGTPHCCCSSWAPTLPRPSAVPQQGATYHQDLPPPLCQGLELHPGMLLTLPEDE